MTNTLIPFIGLWVAAYMSLAVSVWLTLLITVAASGFFIRTFIIFHDCCHHSFFANRKANEAVGIITGILTFFPYHKWKYEHAVHHASSGNLHKRGLGDMWTLTVKEYLEQPRKYQLLYRLYRNPFVMLGLGPIYLTLIAYRFNRKNAGRREKRNTHLTTLALFGLYTGLCLLLGWKSVLLVEGPIVFLSGVVGIWLFYVQHQFEGTYFEESQAWNYVDAALQGSSYYKLPRILQWLTGNIGFHHIHHLSPRVPNYNLAKAHESSSLLKDVPTIGLLSSLSAVHYRLWDEEQKQFVSFNDVFKRYD